MLARQLKPSPGILLICWEMVVNCEQLSDMERVSTRVLLSSFLKLCSTGWNRRTCSTNCCMCELLTRGGRLSSGFKMWSFGWFSRILFELNLNRTSSRASGLWWYWLLKEHCLLKLSCYVISPHKHHWQLCTWLMLQHSLQQHKHSLNLVVLNLKGKMHKRNCFRVHHVSVSCEVYPDTGTVYLCCINL